MQKILHVDADLTLELPSPENAEEMFSVVDTNREHLKMFLVWVDKTTNVDQSRQNIQDRIDGFVKGTTASFVIKFQGKIIGSCGYVKLSDIHKYGEIGYWISKEFEGKGVISKCVKAVIEYGFNELHLHRILIRCNSKNVRSSAVPKKFGFKHEGTLREDYFDGTWYSNTEVFGLLVDEYRQC